MTLLSVHPTRRLTASAVLDTKLKANYNKGLRYAAHLAGDYTKESKRKLVSESSVGGGARDGRPAKKRVSLSLCIVALFSISLSSACNTLNSRKFVLL